MTLTLLLDLDDTLLESNMNAFIPVYFQKLAGFLANHVSPETLVKYLMIGTRQMMANEQPDRTLQEAFDVHFYTTLGVDRESIHPMINQFYDEVFPTLRGLTHPRSGAIELVEWAFERGYRVAIATNPLFPQKAIYHRLHWAGLPPEKYPFDVISSYEGFHFTKPNLTYFAEVLARMGWPVGPVVVVGDDPELDIIPAQRLGLATYWIERPVVDLLNGCQPTASGTLDDLRSWLESVDPQSLQPQFTSPEALLAILQSTPAALASLLEPLHTSQWMRYPRSGEWCITEIICHLRDVERDVNLPRINTVLNLENPMIAGQDTDAWAKERGYDQQDGDEALGDFIATRIQTLSVLKSFQSEDWMRSARHTIFGPTDLQELIGFSAEHDRVHVRQVWETFQNTIG